MFQIMGFKKAESIMVPCFVPVKFNSSGRSLGHQVFAYQPIKNIEKIPDKTKICEQKSCSLLHVFYGISTSTPPPPPYPPQRRRHRRSRETWHPLPRLFPPWAASGQTQPARHPA